MKHLHTLKRQRGFTLLLAALVASITLALGSAIFEIAQKEVTLSSVGRDSQYAFYAADTGAECALYWDMRFNFFGTSTPSVNPPDPRCDNQSLCDEADECVRSGTYPQTMTFEFQPNGYCVDVAVEKTFDEVNDAIRTTVRSDGFSTSCETVSLSPRTLQRSVELHY